jgi:hypothetical protein
VTGPSTVPGSAGSDDEPPPAPVSSARTRRLVLGLAVVLLVLAGAAAVLAISAGAGRDGADPPVAGGSGAGPPAGASAPSGVPAGAGVPPAGVPSAGVPPAEATPPPVPPDDAFRPVPRLCEDADFSPVFDIVAQVEMLNDDELAGPTLYERSCTFRLEDAGSMGTFRVNLSVYSSPDEAQGWFDDILTAEARGEPHEELAGEWDANAVLALAGGPDQADVRFMARDETLVLNLWTFVIGDAADGRAQQAALVEIAAQLRDRARA